MNLPQTKTRLVPSDPLPARWRQFAAIRGHSRLFAPEIPTAAVLATGRPTLAISRQGNSVTITFTGKLLSSPTANGTYQPVPNATSPYPGPLTGSTQFYRAVQ